MDASDFERRFRELVAEQAEGTGNTGCLACER
jgi:hypothetical protein